jgi:hypothetical protein
MNQGGADSHGMNEASRPDPRTTSRPNPARKYAQKLPSAMPRENIHATIVQGRDQRAHAASSRPPSNAEIAKANATENPT